MSWVWMFWLRCVRIYVLVLFIRKVPFTLAWKQSADWTTCLYVFVMFARNTTTNHSNSHSKSSTTSTSSQPSEIPSAPTFRCGLGGACLGRCHSSIFLRRIVFSVGTQKHEVSNMGTALWWSNRKKVFSWEKMSQIRKRFDIPLV